MQKSSAELRPGLKRQMVFYAPGWRYYDGGAFKNKPRSFASVSITGTACRCNCRHCNGRMLTGMVPAEQPDLLLELARQYAGEGCRGMLVSGGACADGSVPLLPFADALRRIADMGLEVVVHPGLLTRGMAAGLAEAGVSRVALDLIGDADTIRDIYHLQKSPDDYRQSLHFARAAGLKTAPHIVLGLHNGMIRGEYAALEMVAGEGTDALVLVVLKPLPETEMAGVEPPEPAEVQKLFQTARAMLPDIPIALGCARPPGRYAREVERHAVEAGFDAIAFPAAETIEYAKTRGLAVAFSEHCCGVV
jgi:uncharacterized radical SAM superfamily protein